MGLIEYVPALITFDYLIVAINDSYAAQVARYIHKYCNKTCGIFTAFNTDYSQLLSRAKSQHKRIITLYKGDSDILLSDYMLSTLKINPKEIRIPVSSEEDGPVIVSIIENHKP